MKVFYLIIFLALQTVSFSQDHLKKVGDFIDKNEFGNAISYIDSNGLTKTEGYRYTYWLAKSKVEFEIDSDKIIEKLFGSDIQGSEYKLTLFESMFLSADWDDKATFYSAIDLGDYIETLDKADPNLAKVTLLFAKYLFELGYYKEAIKQSKEALKANKNIIDANLLIGFSSTILSGKNKAAKYFKIEQEEHPNNPYLYFTEGDLNYFVAGYYTEYALEKYEKAMKVSPEEPEYFINYIETMMISGDYQGAIDLILSNNNPFKHIEIDRYLAQAYLYNDNYEESEKICLRVLKEKPNDIEILYTKAQAHFYRDEYEDALALFIKLHTLDPDDMDYVYMPAEIYYYSEEDEMALQICEKHVKANSEYTAFYFLAADIYLGQEDDDKAKSFYEKVSLLPTVWDDILDYQLIQMLGLFYEETPKDLFNENLDVISASYTSEQSECIINYFRKLKNAPDHIGEINAECRSFVEAGGE